jgi:thiamine-monophosphate kinase
VRKELSEETTLCDIGEREIVRRILPKYSVGIGDDCASITVNAQQVIITTDPVPQPAARVIGNDPDLFWMGWLLVTINASDLAAAGAHPLAFLAAIEAPSSLALHQFERFLTGVKESCASEGLAYVGGNLREASALSAVGTAIGSCDAGGMLKRQGAAVGDLVVSVGPGGIFWRDALALKLHGIVPTKGNSPLYKPHSQLRVMERLAQDGLVVAAIDNSDGLLPTLGQLSTANSVAIRVDLDRFVVPMGGLGLDVDPARLWLGWGDWNVVAVVRRPEIERVIAVAESVGIPIYQLGEFVNGAAQVLLTRDGEVRVAPRLESERFARDSWFAEGIDGYIDRLLSIPLPEKSKS